MRKNLGRLRAYLAERVADSVSAGEVGLKVGLVYGIIQPMLLAGRKDPRLESS